MKVVKATRKDELATNRQQSKSIKEAEELVVSVRKKRNQKKTAKEVYESKVNRMMNGVAYWAAFYRLNIHRFCKDYLNVGLRLFQIILLFAMNTNNYICYVAARGQGKTWLTALFCIVRCILYPGTKIVVCSKTRSQGNEVLLKIQDEFLVKYDWGSNNLRNEIDYLIINSNKGEIKFKNGSFIRVATASDSARGARANILVVDEFRLVDLNIINIVLRKFLSAPREPGYLKKKEYAGLVERNKEIYMSSAWYQSHWSYEKVKSYTANFFDENKKYFVCSLPYQVSILEGLLDKGQVEDEMSESDFDPVKFSMEMESLFFGDTDGAFFTYGDISKQRVIRSSLKKLEIYNRTTEKIPPLKKNERRILSIDVALMTSTKKKDNDAASIVINRAIPSSLNNYISNIVYVETFEGLTTDELGMIVMRYYYEYNCTDIVIDTNGNGLGVFDFIIKSQYDPNTGKTYEALNCCNDIDMAIRCKEKKAKKVIWSIKASSKFNNDAAWSLRRGFQNGNVNILVSEVDAEDALSSEIKGFAKKDIQEQTLYRLPYAQTSLMVNELINLEHEVVGTNIKVTERSGMRKDRYSALVYSYYVSTLISMKYKPNSNSESNIVSRMPFVRPKSVGMFSR